MRAANANELTERAVPVLAARLSEAELAALVPVEFHDINDPDATAEPSKGALIQLTAGTFVVLFYGKESGRLVLESPESTSAVRNVRSFLEEVPIPLSKIFWKRPDIVMEPRQMGTPAEFIEETYAGEIGTETSGVKSIRASVVPSRVRGPRNEHASENRSSATLSPREIRALLAAPKEQIAAFEAQRDTSPASRNRYFCAVRDNVILELLFSTGIRIGELVALDVEDLDLDHQRLQVGARAIRGRSVTLSAETVVAALENYTELRIERKPDTQALFVGRSGTRLTVYSIENIFKKHVRLAEINRQITPQMLRHTMAAMLVGTGTTAREVQEILGHASILSTHVYTKLPSKRDRRSAPAPESPKVPSAGGKRTARSGRTRSRQIK